MQRVRHPNGVITYTFESLAGRGVAAHVSTRHGGVSPEPWRSLNFSVRRGDTPERVEENRRRLAEAVGYAPTAVVVCKQVHGTGVAKVDWTDAGRLQEGADALITDAVGLPLSLVFADCVPVLLFDPVQRVLGICHAGWRGSVQGAAAATLWALQAAYDTNPADVLAGIGPSIGPASYEVGAEVIELAHARLPHAERYFTYPNGPERNPHFDLWLANTDQLVEAGVPLAQIEVSAMDTAQHIDEFFSHRAERGQCGLFCMVAWLKEP